MTPRLFTRWRPSAPWLLILLFATVIEPAIANTEKSVLSSESDSEDERQQIERNFDSVAISQQTASARQSTFLQEREQAEADQFFRGSEDAKLMLSPSSMQGKKRRKPLLHSSHPHGARLHSNRRRRLPQHSGHVTSERIIGGAKVLGADQYPWFSRILVQDKYDQTRHFYNCGASLISNRYVVTAAHCVFDSEQNELSRRVLGVTVGYFCDRTRYFQCPEQSQPAENFGIRNIHLHPGWDSETVLWDVALIELDGVANTTPAVPDDGTLDMGLYDAMMGNLHLKALGFGWMDDFRKRPDILQEVNMRCMPSDDCAKRWNIGDSLRPIFEEAVLCTYSDMFYTRGSCDGDSGGPIVVPNRASGRRDILVGIPSFITDWCDAKSKPDGNARVSAAFPWISSLVCEDASHGVVPDWCDEDERGAVILSQEDFENSEQSKSVVPGYEGIVGAHRYSDEDCSGDEDTKFLVEKEKKRDCEWLKRKLDKRGPVYCTNDYDLGSRSPLYICCETCQEYA